MDATLKERAQKVAGLRYATTRFTEPQITEIAEVHFLLTGRKVSCTTCNVYGLISEINSKLTQEPLIIKEMSSAKFQFKQNAASTEVIRHTKNGTIVITPENINEGDNAAFLAKSFSHLVEETKASKAAATEEGETKASKSEPATKTTTAKK